MSVTTCNPLFQRDSQYVRSEMWVAFTRESEQEEQTWVFSHSYYWGSSPAPLHGRSSRANRPAASLQRSCSASSVPCSADGSDRCSSTLTSERSGRSRHGSSPSADRSLSSSSGVLSRDVHVRRAPRDETTHRTRRRCRRVRNRGGCQRERGVNETRTP